jgi:glycosyltransferase involved in cell wall biosynthesis
VGQIARHSQRRLAYTEETKDVLQQQSAHAAFRKVWMTTDDTALGRGLGDQVMLSVITVTLDNAAGLRKTLESVVGFLDDPAVEVIVVDGGSADDTRKVVGSFRRERLTLVSERDDGVYDAMNKGARLSRGAYLMWLNSGDTIARDDALLNILAFLRAEPLWGVVGAMHLQGGVGHPFRIPNLPHVWWRHAFGLQPHCHQACLFSRRLYEVLGGYSGSYGLFGDFDFILRAGMVSPPAELPEVLVLYEGGGRSVEHADRIPLTLHQIRVDRMGLSGHLRRLDSGFSHLVRTRNRLSRWRHRHHVDVQFDEPATPSHVYQQRDELNEQCRNCGPP